MIKGLLLLLALLIFSCSDVGNGSGDNGNGNGGGNDNGNGNGSSDTGNGSDIITANSQIAELFNLVSNSTTAEIRNQLDMSFVEQYIRDDGAVRIIYRNGSGLQMRTLLRDGVEIINRLQIDVEYWIEKNSVNNVSTQFIHLQPHDDDDGAVAQFTSFNRASTNVFSATRDEFINNFAQNVSEIYFDIWDSYGTEGAFLVSSPNLRIWRVGMHIERLSAICKEIGQFSNIQECLQYPEISEADILIFDSIESMANFAYATTAVRLSGQFIDFRFTTKETVEYFLNTNKSYRIFEFSQEELHGIMRWGFWGHEIGTNHLVSFIAIDD